MSTARIGVETSLHYTDGPFPYGFMSSLSFDVKAHVKILEVN